VLPPSHFPGKNRVTRKQISGFSRARIFRNPGKPLILLGFQKLARHLLYLWHNKNKKCGKPNKNKTYRI